MIDAGDQRRAKGKLGIIAGGGQAPRSLIQACQRIDRPFFVFCLEGQAERDLADGLPHVWLPLGAAERLKTTCIQEEIKEIVMIGPVRRPSLLELKPDALALKILTKIGFSMFGDDGLLRAIGKAIEEEGGIRVIGAHEIFGDLLIGAGILGRVQADKQALQDIARGFEVAHALGRLDVGQAVVVQQGLVLGVEAIEGTDALIARSGGLRRAGPGGVLIKAAKPQQDHRYDLPSVGPETVRACTAAGLRGIALEAQRGLLIERAQVVALADEAGLFVLGYDANGSHG